MDQSAEEASGVEIGAVAEFGGGNVSAARDGSVAVVQISNLEDFEAAIGPKANGQTRLLLGAYCEGFMADHGVDRVENGQ